MAETIRQSDLRNNNAEIMRRVAAGESFTVTVHGRPIADIVPHQQTRKRQFVPAAELDAAFAAAGPDPDPEKWRQTLADADEFFGDDDPLEDPWEREERRRAERERA